MGSGYTGYGAGVGITLNSNGIFDASGYSGLQVWLMGTTSGTRGLGYGRKEDSVHVKLLTGSPDGSTADPRNGDDYGAYCPTTGADGDVGNWVMCTIALLPDGGTPGPVSFDVWIDDIAFF